MHTDLNQRPRVLVLTPRYPYPVIGGDRLRIYEICKELSKNCDLTLLSLCESRSEMRASYPNDNVFCNIFRVYLPKWVSYLNSALAIIGNTPLQVAYYKSIFFKYHLNKLLPDHDVVFSHLIRTADYVRDARTPSVVEMTDAISLNYERSMQFSLFSGLRSAVYSIEFKRLNSYEKQAIHQHRLLTFVSDVDVRYLYGNPTQDKVIVCGNGVDTVALNHVFESNPAPVIAFIGNMVSMQNQDAALWFARDILSKLRLIDDFRFRVVGQIPAKFAEQLLLLPGVEVTGRVSSIPNSIRDCFSSVCPVRIGAGVQNKLLEYMALGLPSVTTSVGQEGLGVIDGIHVDVADNRDAFVEKLNNLWVNREYARHLSLNAREYVVNHHSWENMLSPLASKIIEIAGGAENHKSKTSLG